MEDDTESMQLEYDCKSSNEEDDLEFFLRSDGDTEEDTLMIMNSEKEEEEEEDEPEWLCANPTSNPPPAAERLPPKLKDSVRLEPFQKEFLEWEKKIQNDNSTSGCILADEMGLGKTLDMYALIVSKWKPGHRSLVLCPKSSIPNWISQANEHTTGLIVRECSRDNKFRFDSSADVIVMNYETAVHFFRPEYVEHADRFIIKGDLHLVHPRKLQKELSTRYCMFAGNDYTAWVNGPQSDRLDNPFGFSYDLVILDEAHNVRTFSTKRAIAIMHLHGKEYIAVTGTPMQVYIKEIFSLFYFIRFKDIPRFKDWTAKWFLREKRDGSTTLKHWLDRVMMRRVVEDIVKRGDSRRVNSMGKLLKFRIVVPFEHSEEEEMYSNIERSMCNEIKKLIAQRHLNRGTGKRINLSGLFEIILRCRQMCVSSYLMTKQLCNSWKSIDSTKMRILRNYLTKRIGEDEKVIIFSNFRTALDLVQHLLFQLGLNSTRIDGGTSGANREKAVHQFQTDPDTRIFLLMLKAGGESLNLTAARRVVMLDPWYNPQAMRQGEKRAHRIGNLHPEVIITYIAIKGTIEERVLYIADERSDMFDSIIDNKYVNPDRRSEPSLRSLDGLNKFMKHDISHTTAVDEEVSYKNKVKHCQTILKRIKADRSPTLVDKQVSENAGLLPENTAIFSLPYTMESKNMDRRRVYTLNLDKCIERALVLIADAVINQASEKQKEINAVIVRLRTAKSLLDSNNTKVCHADMTLKAVKQAHQQRKLYSGRAVTEEDIQFYEEILCLENRELECTKKRIDCYEKQLEMLKNAPDVSHEERAADLSIYMKVQKTRRTVYWTEDDAFKEELVHSFRQKGVPLSNERNEIDFIKQMLKYEVDITDAENPEIKQLLSNSGSELKVHCPMLVAFSGNLGRNKLKDFLEDVKPGESIAVDEDFMEVFAPPTLEESMSLLCNAESDPQLFSLHMLYRALAANISIKKLDSCIFTHWIDATKGNVHAASLILVNPKAHSILIAGCTTGSEKCVRGALRTILKNNSTVYPGSSFSKLLFPMYVWKTALCVDSFVNAFVDKSTLSKCEKNDDLWSCAVQVKMIEQFL